MSSSVEDAGSRDPCLASSSRAGSHCGLCGEGGDRYSESNTLYIDGVISSVEVEARRTLNDGEVGELMLSTNVRLQYLNYVNGQPR